MTNDELQSEVDGLRATLAAQRDAEIVALRQSLENATQNVEHYRSEAIRNAELGRKIASDYQIQVADLKLQIEASKNAEAHTRRFGR